MIPIALAAITAILALKGLWIPAIVALVCETLAVLPTPAGLIILGFSQYSAFAVIITMNAGFR